jgi:hypothetical protein
MRATVFRGKRLAGSTGGGIGTGGVDSFALVSCKLSVSVITFSKSLFPSTHVTVVIYYIHASLKEATKDSSQHENIYLTSGRTVCVYFTMK